MQFTKMHGLGNDYIYINAIEQDLAGYDLARLATVLSDRHFGIGGDGIILVAPSQAHDFTMRIFNSDGSEAEMCGNGVRAFARYVYEYGLTDKLQLEIETGAGVIKPSLLLLLQHLHGGRSFVMLDLQKLAHIPAVGISQQLCSLVALPLGLQVLLVGMPQRLQFGVATRQVTIAILVTDNRRVTQSLLELL